MQPDLAPVEGLSGVLANVARLDVWLHIALVVLTAASAWRYLNGHGFGDDAPVVLAGTGLLVTVYLAFPIIGRSNSAVAAQLWCLALVAVWFVLVFVAPSFAWVAVTLVFVALMVLPFGAASLVVATATSRSGVHEASTNGVRSSGLWWTIRRSQSADQRVCELGRTGQDAADAHNEPCKYVPSRVSAHVSSGGS